MNQEANVPPSPRSIPWLWVVLAVAAGLLTLRLTFMTPVGHESGRQHPGVGQKMPPLSLQPLTFEGDAVSLDDLKGKVVVVNFWGTWCPPCRMELPHVAELADHYADDNRCRVLAVSCGADTSDPVSSLPDLQSETAQTLASAHLHLPAYADPEARTRRALQESIGFGGYPTTLVLDRDGVIRGLWTGYAPGDEKDVAELVESLL
jgi:cytochrome c biogenesis protein CcmG/thiol:disulfide interchange protein DsbE